MEWQMEQKIDKEKGIVKKMLRKKKNKNEKEMKANQSPLEL